MLQDLGRDSSTRVARQFFGGIVMNDLWLL